MSAREKAGRPGWALQMIHFFFASKFALFATVFHFFATPPYIFATPPSFFATK